MTDRAHPAPRRADVSSATFAFCLLAASAIWGLRLVVNFAVDSHFCFPGDVRQIALSDGLGWVRPLLIGLDVLTILVAAAAALVSYRIWRTTRDELATSSGPLLEIGEGRTRFLAVWGLIISVGTSVAVLFDFVGVWVIPVCG